jgi:hypothetical protein
MKLRSPGGATQLFRCGWYFCLEELHRYVVPRIDEHRKTRCLWQCLLQERKRFATKPTRHPRREPGDRPARASEVLDKSNTDPTTPPGIQP